MLKTFKIFSLLLSYPKPEIQAFLPEAMAELEAEGLVDAVHLNEVRTFARRFQEMELTDWQAEYVQLFDFSRSASLHLFEHVKGDSKDRGQAMADLMDFYRKSGMEFSGNELPDYLPVFLEFLSRQTVEEAAAFLAEPIEIIDRIYQALNKESNAYAAVMSALLFLSARQPDSKITESIIRNEKPLDLDAEYGDEPVDFGNDQSCVNCKIN